MREAVVRACGCGHHRRGSSFQGASAAAAGESARAEFRRCRDVVGPGMRLYYLPSGNLPEFPRCLFFNCKYLFPTVCSASNQ
jgi:hypothetical protein